MFFFGWLRVPGALLLIIIIVMYSAMTKSYTIDESKKVVKVETSRLTVIAVASFP